MSTNSTTPSRNESPPSSPAPHTTPLRPPPAHHNSYIRNFIQETIEATNPSLRHLASHSSLGSQTSVRSPSVLSDRTRKTQRSFKPLSTAFEEQRAAKPNVAITPSTRLFNPVGIDSGNGDITSYRRVREASESAATGVNSSDATTLFSVPRSSLVGEGSRLNSVAGSARGKYTQIEIPTIPEGEGFGNETKATSQAGEKAGVETHEDGNVYPGPLGLFILIMGVALSVFLISLDRTIITTAIPYISREFQSYDDIGWYGSAYLLTASAFQPLYGRIFTLFNMKWSYLTSLFMFMLGSLLCGVAPSSGALIVGRAIAGLGSAGILTGSFVVVAHAVPVQQRPVLTAVVGLMFGVGATVGPLLGGVFTQLVTWRWSFYFNLPIGGATAFAMIFFFHPPKKHLMMEKTFIYRVFELDLVGNIILLGASIMLFLALQFTEQMVPWNSAKVIGLLVGCGLTFVAFCIWQWWKADGALIPPRIIGQRTVAASCAAGFFIYSAVLIQTYYLPIYFQAIKGASAVGSGVDMIPYVVANALFSLLAGIFVSKNGYFTIPAVVGMVIGTVGCGLITTFGRGTSTGTWIGYEILVSAGIGMAIQQGFTAVQIVLPLDEVAIGTAAVVAFQSLGGAVFVSVGNTILQNSLIAAGHDGKIPGADILSVIDAGAAGLRDSVPAADVDALLDVYSGALRKVFIAAVPMAGLAVVACLFLEFRSVNDKKGTSGDPKRPYSERGVTEKANLEKSRRSAVGGDGGGSAEGGESGRSSWKEEV